RLMIQRLCDEYGIRKLTDLVAGGNCRHESVKNGLARLDNGETKVLIHDGARPLVFENIIANVADALKKQQAVVCAVPIVDTVKRTNEDGFVSQTVDRQGLYAVQTPQGVDVETYRAAMAQVTDATSLTDDASLMERFGVAVKVVDGSPYNIKITTQKDLRLAELYLKGEL
ncbi:MAG: 2-C-methyl-D-erythritol 4-phosphate cytidylyltransferase, partial [Clostridia bacterium]|nr:2-C-methyl-D-erythritol 4-phosphate cytidylyltransferase [Clostridia bacterium]